MSTKANSKTFFILRASDYANTVTPPIPSNYTLIMLPNDIPASLSCFTPALYGLLESPQTLHRAIPELHWKTWWHRWLMTPAESCWQCWDAWCLLSADLQLFYFTLNPWEEKKDGSDRWYSCLVQRPGSVYLKKYVEFHRYVSHIYLPLCHLYRHYSTLQGSRATHCPYTRRASFLCDSRHMPCSTVH